MESSDEQSNPPRTPTIRAGCCRPWPMARPMPPSSAAAAPPGPAPMRARARRWHAYHLIGDVLRSDDLASAPGRDAAFLQRLSARLDDEPAVLAPEPLAAWRPSGARPGSCRPRWPPA